MINEKTNTLKQIFEDRGWFVDSLCRLRPSQKKLEQLGFATMNQWNKVLKGEAELSYKQALSLSKWLDVPFESLLDIEINKPVEKAL